MDNNNKKGKMDGAVLRQLRIDAGYTQEELGVKLDQSRETISAIENNKIARDAMWFETVNKWWLICQPLAASNTKKKFQSLIMKLFNF